MAMSFMKHGQHARRLSWLCRPAGLWESPLKGSPPPHGQLPAKRESTHSEQSERCTGACISSEKNLPSHEKILRLQSILHMSSDSPLVTCLALQGLCVA